MDSSSRLTVPKPSVAAGPSVDPTVPADDECHRRASGGTASQLSLGSSNSSISSTAGNTDVMATKPNVSSKPSDPSSVNGASSTDQSSKASGDDEDFKTVKLLLQKVMSGLSQSVTETQSTSLLDLRPLANICTSATPQDDTMSLNSSDSHGATSTSTAEQKPTVAKPSVTVTSVQRSPMTPSRTSKQHESLRMQKKNYRHEKRRATRELLNVLKDPSIVILADWLKVRGTLKSWTKLWCVLKPGLLLLYKSQKAKSSHWIGTVLLSSCELLERPSKKDGFCFKVFRPLNQSIWATKGPKGENIGAIVQPLPYSYLIFRAPSEAAGKCWMDALELALRCSSLLMRTMTRENTDPTLLMSASAADDFDSADEKAFLLKMNEQLNDSDCEKHFNGLEEDAKTDHEEREEDGKFESDSDDCLRNKRKPSTQDDQPPVETVYIDDADEELGQQGEACQTEEVTDENKGLIWGLVKQVRPGMDLSRVALPTFILEPRSFLDKLSDYYYHIDLLSKAVAEEDPFTRMKLVVRWYLSGFYKKPKGLKKPYNPILGEVFRCYWKHPKTGSRTFYIAEQLSHHPPVSAFYVTNRQEGFVLSGSILAKSKFYGNSLSAIMDGSARLVFLTRGEEYILTIPYAHCKGILIGTLTMELGGMVTVACEKTGYHAELEFKLKPFLGSEEASNRIVGRVKFGSETLATIDGHWDQEIYIQDKQTGDTHLFWNPSPETKQRRLKRCTVPVDAQEEYESKRLWQRVSEAVTCADQQTATQEKFLLEEEQRKAARERKVTMVEWEPRLFERNLITGGWVYKYADLRPWDSMNDVIQFERDMVIQTKTRHQTPIVRATSLVCVDDMSVASRGQHHTLSVRLNGVRSARFLRRDSGGSSSQDDGEVVDGAGNHRLHAENQLVEDGASYEPDATSQATLQKCLEPLVTMQRENTEKLATLARHIAAIEHEVKARRVGGRRSVDIQDLVVIFAAFLLMQLLTIWWLK